MHSNNRPSSREDQNNLSVSLTTETNVHQAKKEGFTTRLRQTLHSAGKRVPDTRPKKISLPDLNTFSPERQELILHAVEALKNEDSKDIMFTLDESRNLLRSSFEELQREQDEYRKKLEMITRSKEAMIQRRKENAIPISIFLRQKRDTKGLADLHPNVGMNTTYQAYFEALLTTDQNPQQHPSDKSAVVKYIRRRERRRRAEENRKIHETTDASLEKQTAELLDKMDGMDMKLEHERQRQSDLLRSKVQEKKTKTQNIIEANEILGQAHEGDLVRQRVEQLQREKIEARLSAVRQHTPAHVIHIQSHSIDEDENGQLTDEQRTATTSAIQLLNGNGRNQSNRSTTPIGDNENSHEKLANIDI